MKKLPKKLRKIAKQAGFVFWANESHGPGKNHIDWASDYTRELKRFAKLVKNAN